MAGTGPPPKHPSQRRRRNAAPQLRQLPHERVGEIPGWPLPGEADGREAQLWAEVWTRPPAVLWEQQRCEREVAQYVRWKVKAEAGSLDAGKEARQLADRLGMTPLALLRLQCEVGDYEDEQRNVGQPAPTSRRLRAVDAVARTA